jgi:hypothetical protein
MECVCPSTETFEPPTVNVLNEPDDFDTVVFVMPATIPDKFVTSAMACLCPFYEKFCVAAETNASSPSISEAEWVCPSSDTAFPFTFMSEASIELKFNWSNEVAAYKSDPLYILFVSDVK